MKLADIAKARTWIGVYGHRFRAQADEAERWLALGNKDFVKAWQRRKESGGGWGDPESPMRYLDD